MVAQIKFGSLYERFYCVSCECFSPVWCSSAESLQGDRWLRLPPMPTARAGAAVAVLGKQILVVGGVGEDQSPLKVVEMYNTEEGRWRKRSSLREALMGVSITVKGTDNTIICSKQGVYS